MSDPCQWKYINTADISVDDVEVLHLSTSPDERLINQFSSWNKLKRSVAWLLKFEDYIALKYGSRASMKPFELTPITVKDIKNAEKEIIRHVQNFHFKDELSRLKDGKVIQKSSKLIRLDPQLTEGILRVGGRLKNSDDLDDDSKHQIILPSGTQVSKLIIQHYHEEVGHGGQEHVLSSLLLKFWILKARSDVRHVLHRCIMCRKRAAKPQTQKMADLPGNPPFTNVGVDCFGPFFVKQGRSQVKRHGCLFPCLSTRAVHIEVIHSLDTDSFINALQKFISRRGRPTMIRSDNGTNFVGAQRELKDEIALWNHHQIKSFLKQNEITWMFNPPTASNFGGVWERIIRSARSILSVMLKGQVMTDETLETVMVQVEGILNSRPLTKSSDDPKDHSALTPNHLLMLKYNSQLPAALVTKEDGLRRRWKQVQHLLNYFWKRWLREYLPLLQERQKWFLPKENLNVGDVVLVCDERSVRGEWPLGLILELYKGKDGLVRSVLIRTKGLELVRPANKLCLLEAMHPSCKSSKPQGIQAARHPSRKTSKPQDIQAARHPSIKTKENIEP